MSGRSSDAHGHEDVAVLDVFVAVFGAHLAGGLGVLELEADFAGVADGFEEVDEVLGVEAYDEGVVVVGGFDGVFGFAGVGGLGGELELVLLEADLDGAGALVGELGDALDAAHEVFGADDDELVVVARQDGFVVWKLPGELAAGEDAAADLEEEGGVVVGELHGFGVGGAEEAGELAEGFAGDEGFLFAGDAVEGLRRAFRRGRGGGRRWRPWPWTRP